MARIYDEKTEQLGKLLEWASGRDSTATLLIPDLQRPYVWSPSQVTLLVDSLIRGWPFGTLLLWFVRNQDIATIPARPFWTVFDETSAASGAQVGRVNPPAEFRMVLDGQQRLQSLLLAVGGDDYGFKRPDQKWCELLERDKPRGKYASEHWSHGQLCLDLVEFERQLRDGRNILEVDYRDALKWIVRGPTDLSSRPTSSSYKRPLDNASAEPGRFLRFSRLWEWAKTQAGLFEDDFSRILTKQLETHGVPTERRDVVLAPLARLLMTLAQVKQSKVAFLELMPFDEDTMKSEVYTDAIVNIFTRLNTAGRALTRQEITFAWIKSGWDDSRTDNKTATACFEDLQRGLKAAKLEIETDELVGAVSTLWSIFRNSGKLLTSHDLLRGEKVRPMAENLVELWPTIPSILIEAAENLDQAGLVYKKHVRSLNAMIILACWRGLGIAWASQSTMTVLQKAGFETQLDAAFLKVADRWILASQWAGVWGTSTEKVFAEYVSQLAELWSRLGTMTSTEVLAALDERMITWLDALRAPAVKRISELDVDDRGRVHEYFLPLWIWHRLSRERWDASQIPLREEKKRRLSLDVDHAVSFSRWQQLAQMRPTDGSESSTDADTTTVNSIGNCSLLEKSFNISKGTQTLRAFLDQVQQFKDDSMTVEAWADALHLGKPLLDPDRYSLPEISGAVRERTLLIKADLEAYLAGQVARVDLAGR